MHGCAAATTAATVAYAATPAFCWNSSVALLPKDTSTDLLVLLRRALARTMLATVLNSSLASSRGLPVEVDSTQQQQTAGAVQVTCSLSYVWLYTTRCAYRNKHPRSHHEALAHPHHATPCFIFACIAAQYHNNTQGTLPIPPSPQQLKGLQSCK